MFKADEVFKRNIVDILEGDGVWSQQARPVYKDGTTANSKYITLVSDVYDLAKGELPITTLREIKIEKSIGEMLWIYQDQSNDIKLLSDKYGVNWWGQWEVDGSQTIGQRYGATVREYDIINKLLDGFAKNPWNRRNIINLWQYADFEKTGGLPPCAFQTMFEIRAIENDIYLDAALTQRSNDMLVAHHINAMQYVALQMMIAKHFGWKVGKFGYQVNNLHIYSNQFEQAEELLRRESTATDTNHPELILDVPDKTNFYDIKVSDFHLINYHPVKPQIKFPDLAV